MHYVNNHYLRHCHNGTLNICCKNLTNNIEVQTKQHVCDQITNISVNTWNKWLILVWEKAPLEMSN